MPVAQGEVWGVTPDCWSSDATIRAVVAALEDGVDRVIIRERRLPPKQRCTIVASLLAAGLGAERILLRVGPHDPPPPDGWAVHLADGVAPPPGARPFSSAAVHRLEELRDDVQAVLVSPFAAPRSKSTPQSPLEAEGLLPYVAASPCPVIALGGITARNAPSAIAAGATGVAAITTVFMDGKDARMDLLDAVHRTR